MVEVPGSVLVEATKDVHAPGPSPEDTLSRGSWSYRRREAYCASSLSFMHSAGFTGPVVFQLEGCRDVGMQRI